MPLSAHLFRHFHHRAPGSAMLVFGLALATLAGCGSSGGRIRSDHLPPAQVQEINQAISHASRGDAAMESGDIEEAIGHYQKSVAAYDGFAAAWNNLGVALMTLDDYAAAEEAFIQAALADPSDPRPRYNRGLLFLTRGYPADARRHFGEALDADPNYLDAMLGAIRCDVVLRLETETTLDLIRKALFRVTIAEDRVWLEQNRLRIEESRAQSSFGL